MRPSFAVDRTLGKLSKWLRILGYDTLYWRGGDWQFLVEKGRGRIFLTRTTKLPHGGDFRKVILVREDNPELQLRSIIRELGLKIDEHRIFSRCLICNRQLQGIPRDEVEGRVPDFVFSNHSDFNVCPGCSRIYWKGTHQENIRKKIIELSPPMRPDSEKGTGG
jgi:hypothetical protein